jgi:hypothetical protein
MELDEWYSETPLTTAMIIWRMVIGTAILLSLAVGMLMLQSTSILAALG